MRHETVEETSAAFIARHFGAAGRAWLATVPDNVDALCELWRLRVERPLSGGLLASTFSVGLPNGQSAVLKLNGPWARTGDEAAALRAWLGSGAPSLLALDEERGALLLEAIQPGHHAVEASASQVAQLVRRLHVEPPAGLPSLGELVRQRLDRAAAEGRSNPRRLAWARETAARRERDGVEAALLHGDLDDRNLLVCERRGIVAIDPLPCVGDPAYDAGYWVHANGKRGRRARFDAIVAATGLPRERVRDWAAIVGVHG